MKLSIQPVIRAFALASALFIYQYSGAQATGSDPENKSRKEKKAEKQAKIEQLIRLEEEGAVVYPKQNLFGIKLYSDGWGAMYEKGKQKNPNSTTLFSLELGERKHPKEEKLFNQSGGGFIFGQPLLLGKINNFFFLKPGIGKSYLIGGKGNKNGVSVSAIYKGGPAIGLLKPYYVDIPDAISGQVRSVKYEGGTGQYDEDFLNIPLGSSGLFKGMNEIKIKPGVFVQGALRFDYGRYNEIISAVEAGFSMDYYFSEMPILVNNEPKKLFLNVFVALEFGRRK